jgi:hypothetical protein
MNRMFRKRCERLILFGLLWGWGKGAIALDSNSLLLLTQPLTAAEVTLLEAGTPPADPDWVTAETISQAGLTAPSLWWARHQFGGKLLSNWLAKPGTGELPSRVDLLVNQQVWTSYNYLDRYTFINQVGTSAKDFGYSTRIFNAQGELLGAYLCDFGQETAAVADLPVVAACTIFLDPSGAGAVRGTGATGALRSIGGSMGR